MLPGPLQAQPTAHYVPGVEGIKGASLPPPGVYLRDYNVVYYATHLNDAGGQEHFAAEFSGLHLRERSPRHLDYGRNFLGGYVGVDALLPLVYQSLRIPGVIDHGTFGIGDLFAEATLSWHFRQFDLSAGAGIWAPTGDSSDRP